MTEFKEITGDNTLIQQYLRDSHDAWGADLSVDEWVRLQNEVYGVISKHNFTNRFFGIFEDGALVTACSCQDRPLYVGKEPHSRWDHAVSGVFTPRSHRKRGLAKQLIDGVVSVYKPKNEELLSLWSDVKDFYARSGFRRLPGDRLESFIVTPQSADLSKLGQFEWIDTAEKLEELRIVHDKQLKTLADETAGAVIEASPVAYEVQVTRSQGYQKFQGKRPPSIFGARLGEKAWATWTYFQGAGQLLVMGVEGSTEQVVQLLKLAAHVAAEEGLKKVELFETTVIRGDYAQIMEAAKADNIDATVETERTLMHPMYISDLKWVGTGGYAWY